MYLPFKLLQFANLFAKLPQPVDNEGSKGTFAVFDSNYHFFAIGCLTIQIFKCFGQGLTK